MSRKNAAIGIRGFHRAIPSRARIVRVSRYNNAVTTMPTLREIQNDTPARSSNAIRMNIGRLGITYQKVVSA
ncbi:MAG: hypothetical protein JWM69_879 [Candidatus Binatus sp.]|nr:hypothetical protein [Candidatus Binatus sp.]